MTGIGTDSSGNVYVSEGTQIVEYSNSGAFISSIGGYGTGDGQFSSTSGLAVDSLGNIFVGDVNTDSL